MGTEVGSLYYDIGADEASLDKALDRSDKKVKSFGDRINKYWSSSVDASNRLLLGFTALGAGAVAFGVSAVKSFQESQNVMAQTEAVLKSTGGAAGITAGEVSKLASALERQTTFSDESIQSAENLLLTFTNIGKDVFPEATKTVLDMSTALGQDLKSSSIQLGKALQDPVQGITALRRVGVNFSDKQKEVIARLVETGQKAKAQKLILKELALEFGGSAKAAGDTFAGKLAQLNNQFDNVKEAIGELIVDAVQPLVTSLLDWFDSVGGVDGIMKGLKTTFEKIQPYFPLIAGVILGMLVPAFAALIAGAATFIATLAPWALLGAGIVLLFQHLGISFDDVRNFAQKAGEKIGEFISWIQQALPWSNIFKSVMSTLKSTFEFLTMVVSGLVNIFMTYFWPIIRDIAKVVWEELIPAFAQLWGALMELWKVLEPVLLPVLKVLGTILGVIIIGAIVLFIGAVWLIVKAISFVINIIGTVIKVLAGFLGMVARVQNTIFSAVKTIGAWFGKLPGYVASAVSGAVSYFSSLPGRILRALGKLGSLLYQAGRDLVGGLTRGIQDAFGQVAAAVKNVAAGAVNTVKQFLGISSPSKVFMGIGKNVTEGFVQGINSTSGQAIKAMDSLSNAVISPTLSTSPLQGGAGAVNAGASNSYRYGDTIVSIGEVRNGEDANYIVNRIDANQRYQLRGGSPQ